MRIALLLVGVFACSTAVIFIKSSNLPPLLLASCRLWVAAAVLSPFFLRDVLRAPPGMVRAAARMSVLPGILLSLHFVSWIVGARLTLAANATLMVNMLPVVMPFVLVATGREGLNRREIWATAAAVTGIAIIGLVDYRLNLETFIGDVVSFASMILFAWYLVLAHRIRTEGSLWLYLVPLYAVGAAASLVAAMLLESPVRDYPPREVVLVLALGVVPTVIGHSILNRSMQVLRGQVVAILNLGQFVFAGLLAYSLLHETPHVSFYAATAFIVVGSVVALDATGKGKIAPRRSRADQA